jgi:HlyD family secretion protein
LQTQRSTTKDNIERAIIESKKTIRQLESQGSEARVQRRYQDLIAPSDGVVFDLRVQDYGVIQQGDVVMTLIPQTGLTANVNISNKDIGFIKLGQKATVRVDAFPANRYGELSGKVSLVGADALPPDQTVNYYRFPVTIEIERGYLQADNVKIPLSSGMSITSNLRIRDKRLITVVSDLLSGQFDSIKSLRQ